MGVDYSASFGFGIDLGTGVDHEQLDLVLQKYEGLGYGSYGSAYDIRYLGTTLDITRAGAYIDEFELKTLSLGAMIPPTRDEIENLKDAYMEFLGLGSDERPNDDIVQPYISMYIS